MTDARVLDTTIRDYAWGSTSLLAELSPSSGDTVGGASASGN